MISTAKLGMTILLLAATASGTAQKGYRLNGVVLQASGKPFPHGAIPILFLQSASTPLTARTEAGFDGKFKFKNVLQGTYVIMAAVPRTGELRKTIEIGPGTETSKGTVGVTLVFERMAVSEQGYSVSTAELSVPDKAWQLYSKAQERLTKPDIEGAQLLLKRAVEIAPQFAAALNQLGTIAHHARRYEEAENYFRDALKQDPAAYSPLVNLGGALMGQGRLVEALPVNEQAVRVKPDDALAQIQLGRNYFELGDLSAAEQHLRMGKALDPAHYALPQLTLIQIYRRQDDDRAIARELEEFLALHPDFKASSVLRRSLEQVRRRLTR